MNENDIADRICEFAAQVSYMQGQPVSRGWNAFWDTMEQLGKDVGPGLNIGAISF